ncbi:LysR family transcriptional regulator [Paraburkholderia bengalensis]|uniref:LysR family transcriptional regulator n=1 Tax=Paraburkholderia bengalensis TaxID=2747562 RepID=A0ABU8IKD3_9BURK
MELRHLKMFCAVAENGSFTAAAEKIHNVQSNVTMRIKELETELSQQLFIRQKNGVVLTSAGQVFLGYAQRILQLTDESRNALLDNASPRGLLRLGSMETTAAIRLPKVLARYHERFPQVQLSLMTGTTNELIKAVECHRLDGAFVGGFHQSATLHQEEIFREELVLVSGRDFASLAALANQMSGLTVLAFRTGCFYRSTLEHWFYQAGIIPGQVMELGTLDGIMSCVAAGMGVTLLPRSVVDGHGTRPAVHCHELPLEFAQVKTVFIRNKDTLVTPALTALLDLSHEQFAIDEAVAPSPVDGDMLHATQACVDTAQVH